MAATAVQEVEGLDRVLTRLALTEQDTLQKVLARLLPVVIEQLKSPHAATRTKVLEILSHVNKRVKGERGMKLPLAELVALYTRPDAAPLVRNFALVYVEMAAERADAADLSAVVPQLLEGISDRTAQHRDMLLRLAVAGLTPLASAPHGVAEAEFAARYPFLALMADRQLFLEFALKYLLYMPPSMLRQATAAPAELMARAAAANRAAAGQLPAATAGAPGESPPPPPPPPGLSAADVARVEGKSPPVGEALANRKLGLLNFTYAAGLAPSEVLLPYIVAAADPGAAVARRGDELMRKRCAVDAHRPTVDLEDKVLVGKLFELFLGTAAPNTPEDQAAAPASPAVRTRLMGLFTKSIVAANSFPATLQVVFTCIYGEGTSQRLKLFGMEFAVWVFKHASDAQMAPMAGLILSALLKLLDEDSASMDQSGQTLRGFTYQAVGQLAARAPALFRSQPDIAARFFAALAAEPAGVRAAVQEATSSLAQAYKGCEGAEAEQIEALLLGSITSAQEAARLCAVQWSLRLFGFAHIPARYICVLGAGDAKLGVRQEALAGLAPPKTSGSGGEPAVYPELEAMLSYLRSRQPRLAAPADFGRPLALEPRAFLALISFLRRCRGAPGATGSADAEELPQAGLNSSYLGLLEHALVRDGTSELHVAALEALLEAAAAAPDEFAAAYAGRVAWLRHFLGHIDAAAREAAAKLCGVMARALPAGEALQLLRELGAAFTATPEHKAAKFEEQDGCMAATGFVLAQVSTGPEAQHKDASVAAARLFAALSTSDAALAATAAAAIGHAGLRHPLPLPAGGPPSTPAKAPPNGTAPASTSAPSSNSAASAAKPAEATINGTSEKSAAPVEATRAAVVEALAALTQHKDPKVVVRAVTALGHLCHGCPDAATLSRSLDAVFALSASKSEEVQFASGEALCFIFGGVPVSEDTILYSNYGGLAAWLTATSYDVAAVPAAAGTPAPMQVDGGGEAVAEAAVKLSDNGGGSGTAAAEAEGKSEVVNGGRDAARATAQDRIMAEIMDDYVFHSRQEVRAAGCVWLLSLVSYTGRHPRLLPLLPAIQEAFSGLLGDSSELTQEMASRGMSVVYSLGDEAARAELLNGLVGVLQGGPKKRRAVKLSGETRVFEEGQIGSAPGGGSISTYKELCALATDLGQPDLVYRFMDLANHSAALNSSRGAAFGFASIAKLAGEALTPYTDKLVPKLYRYQYDPNGRVRDAMVHIWRALVAEPKPTVDRLFEPILAELLREIGGRLWRSREAACAAMADLLQGRRWAEVAPHFEEVWTMALRALDDIKESVRAAAVTLVRSVRSLTLRLADPAHSSTADVAACVAAALPLLLEKGMASSVGEVQGLAVDTVAKLVKAAGAEQVRPHLVALVSSMLESLSGLEDARLNYVEQHAERLGMDTGKLDSLRFSAAKSSPMGDTLDLCVRYVDPQTLESLTPRLAHLVRRGVGTNTRTGAARFIASLATRLASDIRPSAAALIKALVGAARSERSATVRRAYASAAAAVARHAADTRVGKLTDEAMAMYSDEGEGGRDARLLAGLLLRELGRSSLDAFAKHSARVMPLAFLARSDEDAEVAALWGEVWEESGASEAAAVRLYLSDIVPLLTAGLASQQWGKKRAAAAAVVPLAAAAKEALLPHAAPLAAALLAELPGRLWEGKEALLGALGALAGACGGRLGAEQGQRLVSALLAAAGRKNSDFRKAALAALETSLLALEQDHYAEVAPMLLDALRQADLSCMPANSASKDSSGDVEMEDAGKPPPLLESLKCLAVVWRTTAAATQRSQGSDVAAALAIALQPGHPWATRLAALTAAKGYIDAVGRANAAAAAPTSSMSASASSTPASKAATDWSRGRLSPEQAAWLNPVIPGVLSNLEDLKISQVRAAALDALAAVLAASGGGKLLPAEVLEKISQQLAAMAGGERDTVIRAKAGEVRQSLFSLPTAVVS